MTLRIPLPSTRPGPTRHLDVIDGTTTAVQRALRREGLAGYEPATIATFLAAAELEPDGFAFFDVGANVGLYAALCASLFSPGRVVAFEPTPGTARVARKIARVNGLDVHVEEAALGREPGSARLFLSAKSDASNSLVEGFKESTGTVDVAVTTLDAHVERTGVVPSLLKIDVETFEPDVVAGALATLRDHRPRIVVEVLNRRGHDHGEELTAAMDGLGYRYFPIDPYAEWDERAERDVIIGDPGGVHCDWLLTPEPLPADFLARVDTWERALAACVADRNRTTPGGLRDLDVAERARVVGTRATRLAKRAFRSLRD